jgi:hypothetical protein
MCKGLAGRHDAEHATRPAAGEVAGHDQFAVRPEEATRMNSPVAEFDETELLEVRTTQRSERAVGFSSFDS